MPSIKKNFVVSGSSGFIGQHFTKQLESIGSTIWRLGKNLNGENVIDADITKPKWQNKLSSLNPDGVFHFAGINKSIDKKKFLEINVYGTENLLAGLNKTKTWLFVTSSSAVYGRKLNKETKANENSQCDPIDEYGKSKLKQENVVNNFSVSNKNIKVCIGRLSNIIGPGQGDDFFLSKLINECEKAKKQKLIKHIKIKNLMNARDFLDVRDLTEIIFLLFNKKAVGTYNIGSGREMKLKSALLYCKDKYGGIINFDEINNKDDHIYRQNIDIEKLRKKINLRLNFSL